MTREEMYTFLVDFCGYDYEDDELEAFSDVALRQFVERARVEMRFYEYDDCEETACEYDFAEISHMYAYAKKACENPNRSKFFVDFMFRFDNGDIDYITSGEFRTIAELDELVKKFKKARERITDTSEFKEEYYLE